MRSNFFELNKFSQNWPSGPIQSSRRNVHIFMYIYKCPLEPFFLAWRPICKKSVSNLKAVFLIRRVNPPTFGSTFQASLWNITYGRHFWTSLQDVTFGKTVFMLKPLEVLLPGQFDCTADNTLQTTDGHSISYY